MTTEENNKLALNILFPIGAILAFWLGDRAALCYADALQPANWDTLTALQAALENLFSDIAAHPFRFGWAMNQVKIGLGLALLVLVGWMYVVFDDTNRRPGEEYGSTRWSTMAEMKPFANKEHPDKNIILSQNIRMTTEKPLNFSLDRNLNVIVVGGSGSGKTFRLVKPNAIRYDGTYVFTDPKSTLLPELGQGFLDNGYRVVSFNTMDFELSSHYNPLAYIKKEEDILNVVNVLMENTSGDSKAKEDFWVKAERLWLEAHIAYLWMECPEEDRTFGSLLIMLKESTVKEENENYVNAMDIMFEELEKKRPGNFACDLYGQYKNAAGKTAKSILISIGARLAPFGIPAVREITAYDELKLDTLGDLNQKTALFIGVSATNTTYDFLVAILLYQMMDLLTTKADVEFGGALPTRVQLFLDEFANCIGKIPNFEKTIAVIRSQKINAWIFLQSLAQLDALYDKAADIITDNCDWFVFLGGKSTKTTKAISEMMGKQTIRGKNNTQNKGGQGSYSIQDQGLGRDLMDPSEIGRMSREECLVLCTNQYPIKDRKYQTLKDPRFQALKPLNVREWVKNNDSMLSQDKTFQENTEIVAEINADTGEVKVTQTADFAAFSEQPSHTDLSSESPNERKENAA